MNATARMSLAAVSCGVLLLAGCSSDEPAATESAAANDSGIALADGTETGGPGGQAGEGFEGMQPSGLTGEIAYVADGTAQVQDGSTQTAVTFSDSTTVTAEVTLALADVAVGQCVVAVLGDDEVATTISVTEAAEDGTCTGGFGGMGGGFPGGGMGGGEMPADGERPTDMPTAMPEGMEAPEGMEPPEGMEAPSGEMPGGFDMSAFVSGAVTAVGSDSLTVTDEEGTATEIAADGETAITGTEDADTSAIEVGMCLTAQGESDSSGGYAATSLHVFAAGDEGCVSATGFGGRGGMRGDRDGASSDGASSDGADA